ncbi:MAG TPA: FtsW/RodA/SpoVE family cell cycle protein [Actinomycetota bacterium]|nr:FtsW/RodA/SpoVE family cell cycle protein [Actinomycetota bacterium]
MQVAATYRTTRGTQLALTILAVLLSVGAYLLAAIGKTGETPPEIGAFVGILSAVYLLAHLLIVRFAPGADPVLLPTAAVLAGIGYAVIFRLDADLAQAQFGWLMVGLGLFAATLLLIRDHRSLDAYTYTIGLIGVVFLLLPVVPGIGRTINGARLWVQIGPLNFQPAEIGKVLIVIFLASYLAARKELLAVATRRIGPIRLPEPRYMGPLLVAWLLSLAVLFMERDLGSSLLFFGIFVIMLWTATGRGAYLLLGVLLFAAGAYIGYMVFAHVQDRIDIWLNALEPQNVQKFGYGQLAQASFAMATGGIAGTGLGQGYPDLIPFASTDFIFAAIGEELGLFGTTALLLLYVVLMGRGFRAALSRPDGFSKLLAVGLTSVLALQTFIIVGGVMRVIPLTGITLPFVSYGGSSLVANFVLLALLVRISSPSSKPGPGLKWLRRRREASARAAAGPTPIGSDEPTVLTPTEGKT